MNQEQYFEDYELGSVRETFGRTITEADIVIHAGQTGDHYPHHMEEEWCRTQPFGYRIAHGTLIFSTAVGMTANVINARAMPYGYDHLRFLNPVFIGDTLRARVAIHEKLDHKRPEYGVVVERLEALNQNGVAVLVCNHLLLVERRVELLNG